MEFKVYEKMAWHCDDQRLMGVINQILVELMEWLDSNNLLSSEGAEIKSLGVDDDFSLHSRLLTDAGNALLSQKYDEWFEKSVASGKCVYDVLES